MSEAELKVYTIDEVKQHCTTDDLWLVYNGQVYDVTQYLDEHPGGEEVIVDCAGIDATEAFNDIGHSEDAHEILQGLLIGKLEGGVIIEQGTSTATSQAGGLPAPLIAAAAIALVAGIYFYLQ